MKRLALLLVIVTAASCADPMPPPANCPPPPPQAPIVPVTTAPPPETRPLGLDAIADKVVAAINAKDANALTSMFDDAMKATAPSDKLTPMVQSLHELKGNIASKSRELGGEDSATYRLKAERGDWRMKLAVSKGLISGLTLSEPPPAEPPVAKSTLLLGLPFRGQWSVFWGGPTVDVNYHVPHGSQRRATDLVVVDASGTSHKGDGKKNEDYYAWGQDILAVADGTVTQAIDGVPENVPGVMSPLVALGNSVVIEHAGSVFSLYAHLRPGKLKVKAGAKVKKGDLIGYCGNSGNTSEPHLHFQLQDGPLVDHSWGIEPIFKSVTVSRGGKSSLYPEYTWLKGDLVGEHPKR